MNLPLSQHFTLAEFSRTEFRQFDNSPPVELLPNLQRMAEFMEQVRAYLGGKPIFVSSCYRSAQVNQQVGSRPTSSHLVGLACDFTCPSHGDPLAVVETLKESNLNYDQMILEYYQPGFGGWVHIGLGERMRRQVLTLNRHGFFAGINV